MKKNEKEPVRFSKKFIGINEIERRTGLNYFDGLDDLRLLCDFPMRREGADWVLYENDLVDWVSKYKIMDLAKVTVANLKCHVEQCETEQVVDSGKILIGAKKIETFMKKSYISLVSWRSNYSFPLTHEKGLPVLKMVDLNAWVKEHGGILGAITTDSLRRDNLFEQIQKTEEREITGIREIAEFCGRPEHKILDYFLHYPTFPGKRGADGSFVVDSKQLLLWLWENEEPTHTVGAYL